MIKMTGVCRNVLKDDLYHLVSRITWNYMWEIWEGRKTVEYRPPTQFWNTRCGKAQKFLKAGKEVHIVLVNSRKSLKVQVLGVGLMKTGPHFWDRFTLGSVSKDWTPCEVWAIILGDVLDQNGVAL
jgi:hypothetical protein